MTLVVLSVLVIGLFIAALAVYLLVTGVLLARTAGNLEDCLQSVKTIGMHAAVIGPGVVRLNRIGTDLANALPMLYEAAESLGPAGPGARPVGVGYMDLAEQAGHPVTVPAVVEAAPVGVGYLDV